MKVKKKKELQEHLEYLLADTYGRDSFTRPLAKDILKEFEKILNDTTHEIGVGPWKERKLWSWIETHLTKEYLRGWRVGARYGKMKQAQEARKQKTK